MSTPQRTIRAHRSIHSVGEGLFSCGRIGSAPPLDYIVDCGAQPGYANDLAREVALHRWAHPSAHIDLLFISHAHADHTNGLEQLLAERTVGTVVMPMLSTAERVFAFAQSAIAARGREGWDRYTVRIVRDQRTAFDDVAQRVVLVEAGDGLAPAVAPDEPSDPSPWAGGTAEDGRRLIGTIGPQPTRQPSSGTAPPSRVWHCDDSTGFATPDQAGDWLFLPFVDRAEQACAVEFARELDVLRGGWPTEDAVLDIVSRPDGWRQLGGAVGRARRAAGRTTAKRPDINVTSLSVLVRFAPHSGAATPPLLERADWLPRHRSPSTGWLATGDAKLKQAERWQRFRDHYGTHLRHVATAVLPHHGSDENFPPDFVAHLPEASVFVAPAAPYLRWRHPGRGVRLAIRRACRVLYQVGARRSRPLLERVLDPPADN